MIANQHGGARLGLLNPTIYSLANTGLLANGIEDVTSGNNSYNGVTGYNAGAGYDLVTGRGTPVANKIVRPPAASVAVTPRIVRVRVFALPPGTKLLSGELTMRSGATQVPCPPCRQSP